ncbi:MAG: alpha/beta fold hydrolase [Gemmatimonadaceae bacterium]|nr:alpha/beta fold hydrolase [Gemmatimonadaceae bacterium]
MSAFGARACCGAIPGAAVGRSSRWRAGFVVTIALLHLTAAVVPALSAQTRSSTSARRTTTAVPIIFVHGNGDHAGLWDLTIWRFESNGYPADRLFAIDLPHPVATSAIATREWNRSTPEEQTEALAAFVTRVLLRTGASRVALIGSSRGGMTIRNYVRFAGGAAHVSHVITCGTPNHGVLALPTVQPNGEFNGLGPYLVALNRGSEVVAGVKFLTLRSDSQDKYAQPDGAQLGMPGSTTGVNFAGPALRGATNLVLPGEDHREVAFSPASFRAQFRFLTGKLPTRVEIQPDTTAVLDGMISGSINGAPSNLPLIGATVVVHEVDPQTGERRREAVHRSITTFTGRWGPFRANPTAHYEFEIAPPDSTIILHAYRSPFPRSSALINFRLPAPPSRKADSTSVLITRPRGYFGIGRDTVTFNGALATGIPAGVPATDRALKWFSTAAPQSVRTRVNHEYLVVRTQPNDPRRLVLAEFSR